MRILVVEDERKVASFIKRGLEAAHYSVDVEHNGETALNRLVAEEYDLVILDLMLPKLDGLSLMKEIRQRRIKVPVLLLTARAGAKLTLEGSDMDALFRVLRRKLAPGSVQIAVVSSPQLDISDRLCLLRNSLSRVGGQVEVFNDTRSRCQLAEGYIVASRFSRCGALGCVCNHSRSLTGYAKSSKNFSLNPRACQSS
jgi:CheY-like chemotaxis protein